MTLRTYRAYTMAEALTAVKHDLGSDASVLHTRTYQRGGFFGLGRKTIVEITATAAAPQDQPREDAGRSSRRFAGGGSRRVSRWFTQERPEPRSQNAARCKPAANPEGRETAQELRGSSGDLDARRLDLLAAIEDHRRALESRKRTGGASPSSAPAERSADRADSSTSGDRPTEPASSNSSRGESSESRRGDEKSIQSPREIVRDHAAGRIDRASLPKPVTPVAQRFILKSATRKSEIAVQPGLAASIEIKPPAGLSPALSPAYAVPVPEARIMQDEMHAIRDMVSQILQRQTIRAGSATPAMPQCLFDLYLRLVGQEMCDEAAEEIVEHVRQSLGPSDLEDADRVRTRVRERVMALVPVGEEIDPSRAPDGRPRTIALIGPTGVGKTTTLAKLAATFKLREGKRVGLVTSDTYRIAAVEQLRTYANIIGIPLKVVLTPGEMKQACHQLRDCDVILIDTAGRSQKDRRKLDELTRFIEAAEPHEVHLVLATTAGAKVLAQEAEAFAAVRADRLILSKLDEAVSYGMLINLLRQIGKPLSYITTGQEVPDHIEPGRAERIADLILGEDLYAQQMAVAV